MAYISIDASSKLPKALAALTAFKLKVPLFDDGTRKPRLLIVLDYVPSDDLKAPSQKLVGGPTGDTYRSLVSHILDKHGIDLSFDSFNYSVVSFHTLRTVGLGDELKAKCLDFFGMRLARIIDTFEPDRVLVHGRDPFAFIAPDHLALSKGNVGAWHGQLLDASTTYRGQETKFKLCYAPSLQSVIGPATLATNSYLLGFVGECMLPAFLGKNPYHIQPVLTGKDRNFEIRYLTNLKSVKAMFRKLFEAKIVAIDSETDSLNRVVTKLQTMQFSMDGKVAYVVPYLHRDARWSSRDLQEIKKCARYYFERNHNRVQIFTNAKFDLNVFRSVFEVRYFCANVWDILAGESVYDENTKLVKPATGASYLSLAGLSMWYGTDAYLKTAFGKEQRATIHQVPLSDDVLEYTALDVIIPFRIRMQQLARAKAVGYDKYESMVCTQLSDQIHSFSCLESTGALCDIDYLFKLALPSSPINAEIQRLETEFYSSKVVKRASDVIAKANKIPSRGLWGETTTSVFNMGDREHLQVLFIDIMGLEPIEESEKLRPNGRPYAKIDKRFQARYESDPVVKMYTGIQKAYKLRNAYVKSLIRLYGKSDDLKHDRRLRPTYNFIDVVTGRSSAKDPKLGLALETLH